MTDAGRTPAPLVTFLVPTFNSQATLARALQSLAVQVHRDFEVVISDGASHDDTLAIARGYEGRLPALRIDSRPDGGVYDAINQGIDLAHGEWVLVLGSDDRLHADDTLAVVAPLLRGATVPVVYGDVRVMGPKALGGPRGGPVGGRYAGPMPLVHLLKDNVCQQSVFYRRSLFSELGGFDLRYPIWADWDFNVRAALRVPMQWIDVVVSDYWTSGMSSSDRVDGFKEDIPGLLLRELLARPHEAALWPVQRQLLRLGNQLRRRGQWADAFKLWRAWLVLRAQRAMT